MFYRIDFHASKVYYVRTLNMSEGALPKRRRLAIIFRKEVMLMRITLHIGRFTVTVIVKSNNRHSAQ